MVRRFGSFCHYIVFVSLSQMHYRLPLDEAGAISKFEAEIAGKVLTGTVKAKEEAKKVYAAAVQSGRAAAALEQTAPNIFSMSLGSFPGRSVATVRLTYVTTLDVDNGALRLNIPTHLAPRYSPASSTDTTVPQVSASSQQQPLVQVGDSKSLSIRARFAQPSGLRSVRCATHEIDVTDGNGVEVKSKHRGTVQLQGALQCVVSLAADSLVALNTDFVLLLTPMKSAKPRLIIESHPQLDSAALMLSFLTPATSLVQAMQNRTESIFVLDGSGSMDGSGIASVRAAMAVLIRSLPDGLFHLSRLSSLAALTAVAVAMNRLPIQCGGLWRQFFSHVSGIAAMQFADSAAGCRFLQQFLCQLRRHGQLQFWLSRGTHLISLFLICYVD